MDWQTIYTTSNIYQAEILKQVLENEAISAFIINQMDSSYHIGEIYVKVESDHFIRAMEIAKNFENENDIE